VSSPGQARANGAVLWRGPSLIDGAPLVVIAVGLANRSSNRKTGAMVQTYILREDRNPIDAVATGADVSICGDCMHRGDGTGKARTCYVNVGQGPLGVYRAFKRGRYPVADDLAAIGSGRIVRLGTYGDPAAVPAEVWQKLTSCCVGATGYTHQWRRAPALKTLCMASCDTPQDALTARLHGWRTFRVAMPSHAPRIPGEAICPASAEAGKKLQCEQCLACSGANGRRGSIVIQAHGGFAVMANVSKLPVQPYFARIPA
jgi:hypothetical protein